MRFVWIGFGFAFGYALVVAALWCASVVGDFVSRWKYPYESTYSGIPEKMEKLFGVRQRRLVIGGKSNGEVI
jgi:hypothetical protein